MSELALLEASGKIAKLTLNRPEARNAMSIDLLAALHARADELAALANAPASSSPTVLILTGSGKAFCAGMDLKAVLDDPAAPGILLRSLADLTLKLRALPLITLASVNGAAIGGGCGLACVCDIAITHESSKMGFPEVDLGVCPAVVAPWLVRKVGPGRARKILLSGGLMTGKQAFDLGLVDHVIAQPEGLASSTDELAARLAAGGPEAIRATKVLVNELDGSLDTDLVRRGAELSARVVAMPETRAVLKAKFAGS